MKKTLLLPLLLLSAFTTLYAAPRVVPISYDFTATAQSWLADASGTHYMTETVSNSPPAEAWDRNLYNGGSLVDYYPYAKDGSDGLLPDALELAMYFFPQPGQSNWTSNTVNGTLDIGTGSGFNNGDRLTLYVSYFGATHSQFQTPSTYSMGFGLADLTLAGQHTDIYTMDVTAGQSYDFYAYQSTGSQADPLTSPMLQGLVVDFWVTPEPTAIVLFLAGSGLVLRWRNKT